MTLSEELIFLMIQFCHEEGYRKTAYMLQQETGVYFDMDYFEELVLYGNWDEAEEYISGFTSRENDIFSCNIYFEIRKQKFLEALDEHNMPRALEILSRELKVFTSFNEAMYSEMTELLALDDFRKHDSYSNYGDISSARERMWDELRRFILEHPLFRGKIRFPRIKSGRLRRLVNQSLNWQHIHCAYPHRDPDIKSLFVDHQCPLPVGPHGQSLENYQASDFSYVAEGAAVTAEESDSTTETARSSSTLNEVVSPINSTGRNQNPVLTNYDDLPRTVQRVLMEVSSPTSMDFHPYQQNLLLVGTSNGDIGLWDVCTGEKLISRSFRVWKIKNISKTFLVDVINNPHVSVKRISWSPDGLVFGVAYSKHIAQLYYYHSGNDIQKCLELDAHVGGVNDLAFSQLNDLPFLITCGDDKLIQVWDVTTGDKQYTFEGHGAPVYSVYPHMKETIPFIFSTSTTGEIKAWLYDNLGSRIEYVTPGNCCARMAYTADGDRLFSCGTTEDGETFIVEWVESDGHVKRTYKGLARSLYGAVQFDITKNRFLAAGNDHLIKVWDIDQAELLTTIDAEGDLPENPCIRFNRSGILLAVTANNNKIKILANSFAQKLMQTSDNVSDTVRLETLGKSASNPTSTATGKRAAEGGSGVSSLRKNGGSGNTKGIKSVFGTVNKPSECLLLRPSPRVKIDMVSRLEYKNAGTAILALASNGVHLQWKWLTDETDMSGKATTKVFPQLWTPRSTLPMTNDLTDVNFEDYLPCLALSDNGSYVVSASSGKISLFNAVSFKKLPPLVPPLPAVTSVAFYPGDNNIMAIGLDDSTILIYGIRTTEILNTLRGHSERVTGLAFSKALDVLVSSGADAQLVLWNTNGWEKKKSKMLQIPDRKWASLYSNTFVQFHQDQNHFLVIHESQLAIHEATTLESLKKWIIEDCYPLSQATFSGDSQLVYACFVDGTVLVFDASDFGLRCKINPSTYLRSDDFSYGVYPSAIAANPLVPNQFALGLTDGGIVLLEPIESAGKWGGEEETPSVEE